MVALFYDKNKTNNQPVIQISYCVRITKTSEVEQR